MTSTATSSSVRPWNAQPPQDKDWVEKIGKCVDGFEDGIGKDFRERCDRFYRLYRGFKKWRQPWDDPAANDQDRTGALAEGKKGWGTNLHIPYAFALIESMVPQAIGQRPKMLYLPKRPEFAEHTEDIRDLIDEQQAAVDVEITYQMIMRSGFIYGLGVGKKFWRKEYAQKRMVKPRMRVLPGQTPYYLSKLQNHLIFDDPDVEDVDLYDFMWDPYGFDNRSCGWMLHRLWLSTEEVDYRLQAGVWNTAGAKALAEQPQAMREGGLMGGDSSKYDEIWQERMRASGMDIGNMRGGDRPHEVWEWHDGTQVCTVLDRSVLVQQGENPLIGHKPFSLYKPTPLQKQMVGIGELEPIEPLNKELDTLRSMMLDAGIIAMCAGYAYDDQAIDEEDLVFGPASAIRVSNARPSDALMPLPKVELPQSAFNNTQQIMVDIERTAGFNDALAGGDGGSIGTATEAQLVRAAMGKRVENKSRLFEVQVCRGDARDFLALNQRMTLQDRERRLSAGPMPRVGDPNPNVGLYRFATLGPEQLAGEWEVIPEGGTMASENVPQMRADAQAIDALMGNPNLNQRMLLLEKLRLLGFKRPHQYLNPEAPPIPAEFVQILIDAGYPKDSILGLLNEAQQRMQTLPAEGGQPAQGPADTPEAPALMPTGGA